jgi:hypothetical protein
VLLFASSILLNCFFSTKLSYSGVAFISCNIRDISLSSFQFFLSIVLLSPLIGDLSLGDLLLIVFAFLVEFL